jgi:tetraprenyl-beta-curcumene synthase
MDNYKNNIILLVKYKYHNIDYSTSVYHLVINVNGSRVCIIIGRNRKMIAKETSGLRLIAKFVKVIWPKVDQKLNEYLNLALKVEDKVLRQQALSSINHKRFHALGGSVYALYPGADMINTIKFIIALQTISDYLDNLCDRAGVVQESAFKQLHLSMLDAVDPSSPLSDYYLYYPYKKDNGYLIALVEECREALTMLPSYGLVKKRIMWLVELYSNLQSYKHLNFNVRENRLTAWAANYKNDYPDISPWEFSAATGSTLVIFVLFAAAHDPELTETEVSRIHSAYFPWIAGLHILLDYYIDSDEDKNSGDLNFTYYYNGLEHCRQRLSFFINLSIKSCLKLSHPDFHLTVVKGLLAMYLSDPKAHSNLNEPVSSKMIRTGGCKAYIYFKLCRLLRNWGKL